MNPIDRDKRCEIRDKDSGESRSETAGGLKAAFFLVASGKLKDG
jgi:hypothetical protein